MSNFAALSSNVFVFLTSFLSSLLPSTIRRWNAARANAASKFPGKSESCDDASENYITYALKDPNRPDHSPFTASVKNTRASSGRDDRIHASATNCRDSQTWYE